MCCITVKKNASLLYSTRTSKGLCPQYLSHLPHDDFACSLYCKGINRIWARKCVSCRACILLVKIPQQLHPWICSICDALFCFSVLRYIFCLVGGWMCHFLAACEVPAGGKLHCRIQRVCEACSVVHARASSRWRSPFPHAGQQRQHRTGAIHVCTMVLPQYRCTQTHFSSRSVYFFLFVNNLLRSTSLESVKHTWWLM